ncbi:MAG: efflux RND transporter permease subunit, partial [Planctomycetota bacterium]
IFEEQVDFYWSRSRLLEKLSSLPSDALPAEVEPTLGPDATAMGQVYWYTLEGWADATDAQPARPVGGFELHELRSIQDWQVRYALAAVPGVAEVASVGGYVREYQVDVDPDAMRAHGVTLTEVFDAVRGSNLEVGARTLELNRAEYVVRGLGFVGGPEDLEAAVVHVGADGTPVTLREVASVGVGPALRRGALDKAGAEAVGGVVVARYGANPLEVIEGVRAEVARLEAALPTRVLDDGTLARVRVVPFYDRSELIGETLGTLEDALVAQVLVTVAVVLLMVGRLRAAVLVGGLLPVAVLATFVGMRLFGVDANVVALSGIAIAIGTIVDVGIVLVESIARFTAPDDTPSQRLVAVRRGASEVAPAVVTAILTTVVGFLPVFAMSGAEGKLFTPLAWTKTLALIASIGLALTVVPAAARTLLGVAPTAAGTRRRSVVLAAVAIAIAGVGLGPLSASAVALVLVLFVVARRVESRPALSRALSIAVALVAVVALALHWEPAGPARDLANVGLAAVLLGLPLAAFLLLYRLYEPALRWCLQHSLLFLTAPVGVVLLGASVWLGFERVFGWLPEPVRSSRLSAEWSEAFPGLGREFMPSLDEGAFLLMPVTMAHASIGESFELLQLQDRRVAAIPEVEQVVGKIGRAESALDPAPIAMVETVVQYLPEYRVDASGRLETFAFDAARGDFERDGEGQLIPDRGGRPYRQWRDGIESPRDIWDEVARAAQVPGMTTASLLQPIETRRIMLQTGLRAPIGVVLEGPDLERLDVAALELERVLRDAPGVDAPTVLADRVEGKPYLEIDLDRDQLARYGLSVAAVQEAIEVAIGGRPLTTTVEGRERYPVRVRYPRELRHTPEALEQVMVGAAHGLQVPLGQLADLRYTPGPQAIKSENTSLVAYVTFAGLPGTRDVEVVEGVERYLEGLRANGDWSLPPGVRYRFAGGFENQVRAAATLRLVLPIALAIIFLLLYLQFRRTSTTAIVFSGVLVAWSGGFLALWLWGRDGFLDLTLFETSLADLFQTGPIALSVAVWVGFLALFGIATDDGVLMATYLDQSLERERPTTRAALHDAVVAAARRRIRPCLMTTATTTLALIPVLTSRGKGADVMVPMAIPTLGGMLVVLLTVFLVPVLYAWRERRTVTG